MKQKNPGKTRKKRPYSTGEKNKIADSLIHPFYRDSQTIRVFDALVHALIEQDTKIGAKKFIKYNMPEILMEILKKL